MNINTTAIQWICLQKFTIQRKWLSMYSNDLKKLPKMMLIITFNLCFEWIDEQLDFVLNRYSVVDLAGDAKYMINAKLEVCLESGQPCLISHDIAKDLYLPKIGCDWSLDFSSKWSRLVIFLPMIQLTVLWHPSFHWLMPSCHHNV